MGESKVENLWLAEPIEAMGIMKGGPGKCISHILG